MITFTKYLSESEVKLSGKKSDYKKCSSHFLKQNKIV